jgi:ABC-type transport system substrate-binding protein
MVKKQSKVIALILASTMAFSVVLSGCAKKSADTQQSSGKYGGILTVALSSIPKNLDPIKYTGIYESDVICNVADTIVAYNRDLTKVIPNLATEWTVSEDGKVYDFKLRSDVYFQKGKYQDGRKMTAADVKYSLERSAKQSAMKRLAALDHVDVVNDNEVKCYLNSPDASFLTVLTDAGNVIVPKEEVEGYGDDFGSHLVGTGPFTLQEFKKDTYAKLVRNDKFWGQKPYLDGVTFKFITDSNMMVNALKTNEIQVATDVKGEGVKLIQDDSTFVLQKVSGLQVAYIYMNLLTGPTKDKKVREAIYSAIDMDQLVKGIYQYGEAQRAFLPVPPGSWGYDKSLESLIPKYDVAKAKQLLTEAGYPNGFKTQMYISNTAARIKMATIVQQFLKQNLNIDVEIKPSEWGTFSDIAAKGKAPIFAMSWSWYPDPFFFLNKMFHSSEIGGLGNGQGYNNPAVDKLLNDALLVSDQNVRAAKYKEATKLIVTDLPAIWYANESVIYGLSKKVQGLKVRADSNKRLVDSEVNVYLEK